eukprot:scaffold2986_cov406-Prasinococcus_capsulatus_cf.AAC.4
MGDIWLRDFADAKAIADDAFALVNERQSLLRQNQDAAKVTMSGRRAIQQLKKKLRQLEVALQAPTEELQMYAGPFLCPAQSGTSGLAQLTVSSCLCWTEPIEKRTGDARFFARSHRAVARQRPP